MEQLFDFTKQKKPKFLLLLMHLEFLILLSPIKYLIKRYLKDCQSIDFFPGFIFFYGNIKAKNVHLGNSRLIDYAPITIGENSMLGWDCTIITGHHDENDFSKVIARPVTIGKNVKIYSRSIILGGVTIGDNSVIGAGSVVTNNIPANVFAGGNPAKIIKKQNLKDT